MDKPPKSQLAIIADDSGRLRLSDNVAVPDLEEDMVLVKTQAVALNPADVKMLGPMASPGAVAGHDYAGVVVAVGSKAWTAAGVKVGDRVCGAVMGMHGLTPKVGAYAQYVGGWDVIMMKIPVHMSFEEGATLGTGCAAAGMALFHSLQIPGYPTSPASAPKPVLVWGGSTAVGTLVIQFLKLSGMEVVTTCSPQNFDLVRSYGADHVLDYRSADCISTIKKLTRNSLRYVVDCVSEPETMDASYRCIGRLGGRFTALEPPPKYIHTRPRTVQLDWVMGAAVSGKPIAWPAPMGRDANPGIRGFAREWFSTVQELLDQGKLKPHPQGIMAGGLARVPEGVELLRKKQVSGRKLVYPISAV